MSSKNESRPKGNTRNGARKVLVTGATSSIGRNLILKLAEDPQVGKILGVGKEEQPYFFKDLDRTKFGYSNCNILRDRDLKNLLHSRLFLDSKIDTVVHLAFHNTQMRGEDVHELNVNGTKNLVEACMTTNTVNRFIFKSSDVVYKLNHSNPVYLDENAELNFDPEVDQWIKDRVDADMICRSYMDNKAMKIVILRMTNIIGRHVSGQFNAYFDSKPMFKTMGFNPLINLLHMKDVLQSITLAIFKNVKGVYNIAGLDTAPITTFAELNHSRLYNVPEFAMGPLNWLQRKLNLTQYYYSVDRDRQKYTGLLDISKARHDLGFNPQGRVEF
ncbi:MAG: NAD-dependent epimerase/dehydratase family protein [Myxococcota bacterium]|jgi:UDP-glucose 4-epimerase